MPELTAGTEILAIDYPATAYDYDDTIIENVSGTTFAGGSPAVGETVLGPTSGQILVICGAATRAQDRIHTAPQLRETNATGAILEGTTVVQHGFGGAATSLSWQHGSRVCLWEGLEQGAVYFIRHMHRRHPNDGTSGDIRARAVAAIPLPFYWTLPTVGAPVFPLEAGDAGDPLTVDPPAAHAQSTKTLTQLDMVDPDYQPGTPEVGVVFRAPRSGKALCIIGGGARDNGVNENRVFLTVELFKATRAAGTPVVNAASESFFFHGWAASGDAPDFMYGSRASLLENLDPGITYYARVMHTVESPAGTADINVRDVTVVPVPATAATNRSNTSQLNIASTSYTNGSPEVGVQFPAPPSGRILLAIGGGARDSSAGQRVFISPEIFEGASSSGTQVLAPSVVQHGWGTFGESSGYMYGSRVSVVAGLTPGATHYARVMHTAPDYAGGTGTADVTVRDITVVPIH